MRVRVPVGQNVSALERGEAHIVVGVLALLVLRDVDGAAEEHVEARRREGDALRARAAPVRSPDGEEAAEQDERHRGPGSEEAGESEEDPVRDPRVQVDEDVLQAEQRLQDAAPRKALPVLQDLRAGGQRPTRQCLVADTWGQH